MAHAIFFIKSVIEPEETMKTSSAEQVRELYEQSADAYAKMMDAEIDLPIYSDILSRLTERIADTPGPVLDTSCGSGHMLSRYRKLEGTRQ